MPRPAASIQTEIDAIEAELSAVNPKSVSGDQGSMSMHDRSALELRLEYLYRQLDMTNGTRRRFVRGVVKGLG